MSTSKPNALDVRPLPPSRKAVTVRAAFDRLDTGESFILVDNRDPSPLFESLKEERSEIGTYTYLRDGPHVWHVRIRRAKGSDSS